MTPPGRNFLLLLLKFVSPQHFVFSKSYVRPKPQRNLADNDYLIEDHDSFFEGLPECAPSKRTRLPGVTKAMKLEKRKKALEAAHKHIQAQIAQ